jgi:hypothetical protein
MVPAWVLEQVEADQTQNMDLTSALCNACAAANLQATPAFLEKARQLNEMLLVGDAFPLVLLWDRTHWLQ